MDLAADPLAVPGEFLSGRMYGARAAVFDDQGAADRFLGQRELVMRVASEFATKCEASLEMFERYYEDGAFEELQYGAHGLKGGAWNLEARRVGDVAAQLEGSARMKDGERCRHFLDLLGPEIADLAAAVRTLRTTVDE
jgi:HPt (histidine-containing phosphotransfer) domain-containing protein